MNKKIIKVVVLVLVFFLSLAGLSLFTNTDNMELTSEMPEATLPVIYLQKEDIYINELFGYRGEMDALSIRDSITPLSEDMVLPVTVQAFDNHVEGISYEVRTMDMERLLEETQVSDYSQADGMISTKFQIQNLLEEEREYRLIITLECQGEKIRYYTRIIRAEKCYVDDSLEFALDFHAKTFDPEASAQLATYLEPNKEGDNTTLQKVTIHSSLKQIAWGDFDGKVLKEPVPTVKEINSSYNAIVLNYIVASTGENGETEFYNVEEYYRLRYSTANNRMYLLDYERTMNEIFRGSGDNFSQTAVLLGIRDTGVSYMANENATIIGFVQEGDLWSYNSNTNQLSLVYSFRGIEGLGDRENHSEHDIKIIKVSEAGSIDFVVYGYMNRGEHEGFTGIGVYHYDSIANTIQEELFVQSKEAYQILKETWGKVFYVSDEGYFYMLAEENVYRIRLDDGAAELMQTGLNEENFAVSDDGRYIAWREEKEDSGITVTDLEGESQWQIPDEDGDQVKPIGFVESDFVYGIAKKEDISENEELLYKIVIIDKEQQVIKEYQKDGYYVTDAYVDNATVFLERVWKNENTYMQVEADAIKSHEIEAARNIQIETFVTEQKQTQVRLVTGQEFRTKAPQVLTPKEVVMQEKNQVTLDTSPENSRYDVYVGGKVVLCTENVSEAVRRADAEAGVVINGQQQYIWRRGMQTSISMADKVILDEETVAGSSNPMVRCITALLQAEAISVDIEGLVNDGETPRHILQEAMPSAKVLNLSGCTVSQVLYYASRGSLIYALGENQEPLLIAGYDEINVILYDPRMNAVYKMGISDSEDFFASAGNVFITYLKD